MSNDNTSGRNHYDRTVKMGCFDISQATNDIYIRPLTDAQTVTHDPQGIEKVVKKCLSLNPERIIIEATGGMEIELAVAQFLAQLPVVVINPRLARDFARATGELAPI